ncbi:MAG: thioredoxin domain-containing protein [Acidobacteriota bacterium]
MSRLSRESSPYLRQHADNPVDWYPWGEEALARARGEDKPILLSIGYSSCHWCHVMERESFEDPTIAALMNDAFVNIKVDREERPDLDSIYMTYVQASSGQGGWPLTVFLTPQLVPFYGGTYFPPHDLPGRPGFPRVLKSVAEFYRNRRQEIAADRPRIAAALEQASYLGGADSALDGSTLEAAASGLLHRLDHRHGGFGEAPKFPAPMALSFLLRVYHRNRDPRLLDAVTLTLDAMARGGIFDQIGGGFHRYSTDARWLVPHFEKMLYDNALLSRVYLAAFQVTGRAEYRRVVEQTLDYVIRQMLDPSGGFYSAEDADSEGVEGRFYVWSAAEIEGILGAEQAELFNQVYGVREEGNWEGTNILHRQGDMAVLARGKGLSAGRLERSLERCRHRLLEERDTRVRPALDDKILASWNGLMLGSFAEAAFTLREKRFLEVAERAAGFLWDEMVSDGRLHRTWKDGTARLNAYLEDYADVTEGYLRLFQTTGKRRWLEHAVTLTRTQIEQFWDDSAADFFFTSSDHEELLIRPKEHFDNATPSGNSTSARNLLELAELTGEERYGTLARRMLERLAPALSRYPDAFGNWLCAADSLIGPVQEIVVVGEPAQREPLVAVIRRLYLPRKVLLLASSNGGVEGMELPLLEGRTDRADAATAYVCESYTCREPTSDPEELARQLSSA